MPSTAIRHAFFLGLSCLAISIAEGAQIEGVLYQTGFEATEPSPFHPGDLNGQNQWSSGDGAAVVQSTVSARGSYAVQAGQANFRFGAGTNAAVVWVDAFILDPGSAHQPMIPSRPASSVIFLSSTHGILALDGDAKGHGNFIELASDWPRDQFVRISVRNDYSKKTYDVWLNGNPTRQGLRFKDDVPFTGVQRRSNLTSYLDDFSVTTWGLDADSDHDGLVDLDEVKFHGSHPLKPDTDGDGMDDGQEILAGTHPGDPVSLFALRIEQLGETRHQIRLPTVTGRLYTLQRRAGLNAAVWESVESAISLPGDGTEQVVPQDNDGTEYFYRALVNP